MQFILLLFTVAASAAQLAVAYPLPRGRGLKGSTSPPALDHLTSTSSQSITKERSLKIETDKKRLKTSDDFNSPKVKTNPHLRTVGSETVSSLKPTEGQSATFENTNDIDVGGVTGGTLKRANAVKKQKEGVVFRSDPFGDTEEEINVSGMNPGKKLNRKNAKKVHPQKQSRNTAPISPTSADTTQDAVTAASSSTGDGIRFGSRGPIDGLVVGVGASALVSQMESSSSSTSNGATPQPPEN